MEPLGDYTSIVDIGSYWLWIYDFPVIEALRNLKQKGNMWWYNMRDSIYTNTRVSLWNSSENSEFVNKGVSNRDVRRILNVSVWILHYIFQIALNISKSSYSILYREYILSLIYILSIYSLYTYGVRRFCNI